GRVAQKAHPCGLWGSHWHGDKVQMRSSQRREGVIVNNKIRVVLRPDAAAPKAEGWVDCVHVALSGFGGPGSRVGAGAQPATLVLHIAFLEGARGEQTRDFKPFATIRG